MKTYIYFNQDKVFGSVDAENIIQADKLATTELLIAPLKGSCQVGLHLYCFYPENLSVAVLSKESVVANHLNLSKLLYSTSKVFVDVGYVDHIDSPEAALLIKKYGKDLKQKLPDGRYIPL